ncbi:MAG: ABC transporter ATP-binding protein [Halomonas sp.]
MTASISINGLHHSFGDFHALKDIDLSIDIGEYTVLLGPSGCGKTTLLSILGGFLVPSRGHVMIGDKDMTRVQPAKRPTTTMFQDYALFPHMTLKDNVAFGLRMRGLGKTDRHAKADQFLELVGLRQDGTKRPHELSGGQRQRVALARALAVNPDVLLLDEPLGALDLKLRRSMQDELKAIQREVGTTFVHVTHDQEEAMAIADRIVVMNAGRIEDQGPPDRVYRRPCSLFAANFMGEVNQIPAWRDQGGLETPLGPLPLSHDFGDTGISRMIISRAANSILHPMPSLMPRCRTSGLKCCSTDDHGIDINSPGLGLHGPGTALDDRLLRRPFHHHAGHEPRLARRA